MIVVRNTFRIKFGQAKPAVAAWKEGRDTMARLGMPSNGRLLTDLTGPSYTLALELQFKDLAEFEEHAKTLMAKPEWRAWYEKFIPYCESGSREIFNIVE